MPASRIIESSKRLAKAVNTLRFRRPVAFVYNPLHYAWHPHEAYLRRYAQGRKRILFLGMNPGPFGMAQTGIPFGEIAAVREWLRIEAPVGKPVREHPKRPILGFGCQRSEVSGRRLWGLFEGRFVTARKFFAEHFVLNYCPLAFLDIGGRNVTPDKLSAAEQVRLFEICDKHLHEVVQWMRPDWLIGVGNFAARRATRVFPEASPKVGCILHPSPASPAANRNWSQQAAAQLNQLGIWRQV